MKTIKIRLLIVVCVCLLLSFLTFSGCEDAVDSIVDFAKPKPSTQHEHISFDKPYFNLTNNYQYGCRVRLSEWNGQLYFYVSNYVGRLFTPALEKGLFVFSENGIIKIGEYEHLDQIVNGFAYYYDLESGWHNALDLETRKSKTLIKTPPVLIYDTVVDWQGTYYIPTDIDSHQYCPGIGGELGDSMTMPYVYCINGYSFYYDDWDLFIESPDGCVTNMNEALDEGVEVKPIPCENGALFLVEIGGNVLNYFDATTGTLTTIFEDDAYEVSSAVNVHDGYAYLSIKRYAGLSESGKGMVRYENDTREGTYRISLADGSYEKICDGIYDGIYIFDDSGMYVVNENNDIIKLSFDGKVIDVLLKH